jgi:hypothetical protein
MIPTGQTPSSSADALGRHLLMIATIHQDELRQQAAQARLARQVPRTQCRPGTGDSPLYWRQSAPAWRSFARGAPAERRSPHAAHRRLASTSHRADTASNKHSDALAKQGSRVSFLSAMLGRQGVGEWTRKEN